MSTTAPVEFGNLTCPACGAALGPYGLDAVREAHCPSCRTSLRGEVFRAWWTPPKPEAKLDRALEGEAVCYFHPSNRAALTCDSCGRFICSICDLPVGTRHLCPVCLSKGVGQEKLTEIVPKRLLWARFSLSLGFWPLPLFIVLWWAYAITGGTAVIAGIISFFKPGSLVRGRQRAFAVFGILFGLVQIAVFCGMIGLLMKANSTHK